MRFKSLKHLVLITKHRHQVLRNAIRCGIFFSALGHDLSKYSPTEFFKSAKYYSGNGSPVYAEREVNGFYSEIAIHHTRRNKHHYEYWVDIFRGKLILKIIPYRYIMESVCDMLAASKTYNKKEFSGNTVLKYFEEREKYYVMHPMVKEYMKWCFTRFQENKFKGLKKKDTKAKYDELCLKYPRVVTIKISA